MRQRERNCEALKNSIIMQKNGQILFYSSPAIYEKVTRAIK